VCKGGRKEYSPGYLARRATYDRYRRCDNRDCSFRENRPE